MEFYMYPLWNKNSSSMLMGFAHHSEEREVELFLGLVCFVVKY